MSTKCSLPFAALPHRVIHDHRIDGECKTTLMGLTLWSMRSPTVTVSNRQIANHTGQSLSVVRSRLKLAEKAGHITCRYERKAYDDTDRTIVLNWVAAPEYLEQIPQEDRMWRGRQPGRPRKNPCRPDSRGLAKTPVVQTADPLSSRQQGLRETPVVQATPNENVSVEEKNLRKEGDGFDSLGNGNGNAPQDAQAPPQATLAPVDDHEAMRRLGFSQEVWEAHKQLGHPGPWISGERTRRDGTRLPAYQAWRDAAGMAVFKYELARLEGWESHIAIRLDNDESFILKPLPQETLHAQAASVSAKAEAMLSEADAAECKRLVYLLKGDPKGDDLRLGLVRGLEHVVREEMERLVLPKFGHRDRGPVQPPLTPERKAAIKARKYTGNGDDTPPPKLTRDYGQPTPPTSEDREFLERRKAAEAKAKDKAAEAAVLPMPEYVKGAGVPMHESIRRYERREAERAKAADEAEGRVKAALADDASPHRLGLQHLAGAGPGMDETAISRHVTVLCRLLKDDHSQGYFASVLRAVSRGETDPIVPIDAAVYALNATNAKNRPRGGIFVAQCKRHGFVPPPKQVHRRAH